MESLFVAEVPVATLKGMLDAAAPFCKVVNLVLSEEGIRFHGTDDGRNASIVGTVRHELEAMGPGIQVGIVVLDLAKRLSPMDTKGTVVLEIEREGKKLLMRLKHGDTDHEVTVEESDVPAVVPEADQTGSATLDPLTFSKVVAGLKNHTDVVSLEIQRGALAVSYKTNRSRESWKHPCSTGGKGLALFSTALLQAITKGAAKVGKAAALHIGKDMPLKIHVEGEALEADLYLGDRSPMS